MNARRDNPGRVPARLRALGSDARLVFRRRGLRLVFGATLISDLGDGIVTVALAFAVLDLTGSVTDLGLVLAARSIAQVAALLIGGVVADRLPRRTVMLAADIARCAVQVSTGVLLLSGHATVAELVGSQAVVGAGGSFFIPASIGLLQEVAGEHVRQANALKAIAGSGSQILGPALGGTLVVVTGPSWALVLDGASYLLSALLLSGVREAAAAGVARGASFLADLRGGLREVTSRTWLWSAIAGFSSWNLLWTAWPVLAPVICKRHYGGAAAFATLTSALGIGMLAGGALLLAYTPRFPLRSGILAVMPATLPGVALALHAPLVLVAVLQLISGAALTAVNTCWWTTMQQQIPAGAIARVSSYDYAGSLITTPIGYALVAPLAAAVGITPALIACSVAAAVVVLPLLLVGDVRRLASAAPATQMRGSRDAG